MKVFNFSSGPSILPVTVLQRTRDEMLSFNGIGMSVMEISHRSEYFEKILADAESGIRGLLQVPSNYSVLFLQGGASLQFSMIPINFLKAGGKADYIITGVWGEKALIEAKRCGNASAVFSSAENGYRTAPRQHELAFDPETSYIHYTSNETIDGIEFKYDLNGGGISIICDASSNILSKPIDIQKYALIYAGAQKNIGPSGVTVVIIRDDMIERVPENQHSLLDYRAIAKNGSMVNTPNTWGIYLIGLVCEWLKEQGGLSAMAVRNEAKAKILYDAIDGSDGFYKGHAERSARSLMNVTFRLPTSELDEMFCSEAKTRGFNGLRGHRTVGGIRASIYNAFPVEGVERLVEFMADFAAAKR